MAIGLAIIGLDRWSFDRRLDHWRVAYQGGGVTMSSIIRPSVPKSSIIESIFVSDMASTQPVLTRSLLPVTVSIFN